MAKSNRKHWQEPSKGALARCRTCRLPTRAEIEKGFALGTHNSVTFQKIYDVSYTNAKRHYETHLSPAVARAVLKFLKETMVQALRPHLWHLIIG